MPMGGGGGGGAIAYATYSPPPYATGNACLCQKKSLYIHLGKQNVAFILSKYFEKFLLIEKLLQKLKVETYCHLSM